MDEQPGPPGECSPQVLAGNDRDGAVAANGRHVTLVSVAKWDRLPSLYASENVSRGARARLHRRGSDAGHGAAPGEHRRKIADDEDLRMPWNTEIRLDQHSPAAIEGSAKLTTQA